MRLALKFRNVLPSMVREELDSIVATVSSFFMVEHKDDGTHGDIHASSLTVSGDASFTGSLIVQAPIVQPEPPNLHVAGEIKTDSHFEGPALNLISAQPLINFYESTEPLNLKQWRIQADGQLLQMQTLTDTGTVLVTPLYFTRAGVATFAAGVTVTGVLTSAGVTASGPITTTGSVTAGSVTVTGGIVERGRTVPLGEWIAVPYNASDFSASAGTWTVEAADLAPFRYTLIGKTMIVNVRLFPTTLSAAANQLRAKIPGGYVSAVNAEMPIRAIDSGGRQTGNALVSTGSNLIAFEKINDTQWAAGTNTVGPLGTLVFEIQ